MSNQSDYPYRCKNFCENINSFLYKIGHEPSLAGYRIQEHVHKTVPTLSQEQYDISMSEQKIKGTTFDIEYTQEFMTKLDEAVHISRNTRELISELASKVSSNNNSNSNKN